MFDLCVIGGGPAGIITALEYARKRPESKIALVEYGGPQQSASNSLDDSITINSRNHHQPYDITVKGLGGTSATWGGRCVDYDHIDFADREVLGGNCTWDERIRDEYRPYLKQAAAYFECGEPLFSTEEISEYGGRRIAEHFRQGPVTDTVVERYSMPTRFGVRYAEELRSRGVELLSGYEGRGLVTAPDGGRVTALTIRNVATGKERELNAGQFIIATGAQESTRMLLRNPQVFDRLEGVPHALGRYYQSHISGKIAAVDFYGDPAKTDYGFVRDKDGAYVRRRLQFTEAFLQEHKLLNTAFWLDNPPHSDAAHRSGPLSFIYLAMITPGLGKKLAPPTIAHSITKGVVRDVPGHLKNVVGGLPQSLTTPASIFYRRYLRKRKLPGIFLYNPRNHYALHFHAEQLPAEKNRMQLEEDGETLRIDYSFTNTDLDSIIRSHEALDEWLRACNCGELTYYYPRERRAEEITEMSIDGVHQNGTTRIGASAQEGVVDRNLKVFGTDNLYVCSSSAFPTSGQANPTFLLGTFAVRLADHLSRQ